MRIRAKMAKNLTDGRRTGGAAVGCGFSDRKFDCLLPTSVVIEADRRITPLVYFVSQNKSGGDGRADHD